MPDFFIDLAVPNSADRVFTYSVPPHLRPLARTGVRALAPFGKKTVAGIVVATPASSDVRGIRDILDIIDDQPVISEELMKLAGWMSAYYHVPIGEALRPMLISGFTGVGKTTVRPAADVTPELLSGLARSPLQQAVMRHLAGTRKAAVSTLRKALAAPSLYPALHELRRKGYVTLDEERAFKRDAAKVEPVIVVDGNTVKEWRAWLEVNGEH